jgi:hypothetical protein
LDYLIKYHGEIPLLEKVEVKNANRMRELDYRYCSMWKTHMQ